MKLHKEGNTTLFIALIVLFGINYAIQEFTNIEWLRITVLLVSIALLAFLMYFFRNPVRNIKVDASKVVAPADGKVVLIEEVDDAEYFQGKRLQISIFMSPLNVHVNRFPVPGKVVYAKYHPGKFFVAWHPKASTLNERTTVVQQTPSGIPILYRQIAGAMARRIVMYAKEGMIVQQGSESGFIKFGSRVDILLPSGTAITVNVGDKTKGGETILAKL
ncbi:MAG: phosphatidylserine decarboxylase family protein [Schleiferiaceae bacterium]|nr:phosphatidylserine decarboxylase family protein [Schleiferiaceae bacterium]